MSHMPEAPHAEGARPGIEVERLVKRYAPSLPPAVDGMSFRVEHGEVYALLGPNGSGKSTTIGVLATLLRSDEGRVYVAGHDVATEPDAVRRRIGVALQETGVDARATGHELIARHARLLGMSAMVARSRAGELLEEFGLADAGAKRLGTYSGGMRRRLDLALALTGRPSVVFLDEPTTGLDPFARQDLWDRVRRLRAEGAAVLLTTQYLEEADALADRIGIVAAGRLRIEGTADELKRTVGGDVLTIEVESSDGDRTASILSATHEGSGRVSLEVADGGGAVPRVLAVLTGAGIEPRSVVFSRPSLDDVFRQVVGGHLAHVEPSREEAA